MHEGFLRIYWTLFVLIMVLSGLKIVPLKTIMYYLSSFCLERFTNVNFYRWSDFSVHLRVIGPYCTILRVLFYFGRFSCRFGVMDPGG